MDGVQQQKVVVDGGEAVAEVLEVVVEAVIQAISHQVDKHRLEQLFLDQPPLQHLLYLLERHHLISYLDMLMVLEQVVLSLLFQRSVQVQIRWVFLQIFLSSKYLYTFKFKKTLSKKNFPKFQHHGQSEIIFRTIFN
jgi:hypothetical protein